MTERPLTFAAKISIQNFRGYGMFALELPAEPCVVLLSGPNGLGKTSFFEAVEWCLTGSVKRLDLVADGHADPRDLGRIAPNVDGFDVELAFQDAAEYQERIVRAQPLGSSASPSWIGTSLSAVADHLRSDEIRWQVTGKNLADYLHLTHFHTQAAALRLVTIKAKDRWVRVSPLAGAERFERVRANLTNTKAALTRLRDQRAGEFEAAVARKRRWADLLVRCSQLEKLAGARHDIQSPQEILGQVVSLRTRHALEVAEPDQRADVGVASDALRQLRGEIERQVADNERRIKEVLQLRPLIRQVAEARAQQLAALAKTKVLTEISSELREKAAKLSARLLEVRALRDAAVAVRVEADRGYKLVSDHAQDREDQGRLEEELRVATDHLRSEQTRGEEAEAVLRANRDALAAAASLEAEVNRARGRIDAIAAALLAYEETELLRTRTGIELERQSTFERSLNQLAVSQAATSDELVSARQMLNDILTAIVEHQQDAAKLHGALLTLVDHISDDAKDCPVCSTSFPPTELKRLAQAALVKLDPKAGQLEARAVLLRSQIDELDRQQVRRARERRKLDADLRAVADNLKQLNARIETLQKQPLLANIELGAARDRLGQLRAEAENAVREFSERRAEAGSLASLESQVLLAEKEVNEAVRACGVLQERRNVRQMRLTEVLARISRALAEYPQLDVDEQSLRARVQAAALHVSNARDEVDRAVQILNEAQSAEQSAAQALISVDAELEAATLDERSLDTALQGQIGRWKMGGLAPPPAEDAVNAEVERLAIKGRGFAEALETVSALATALERWQQSHDLQTIEEEIRQQCQLLDRGEYDRSLDAAVERARSASAVAQRARDGADKLSASLGAITAEFSERALMPFGDLFRRYLRALVHDERFHNIEASYEASARSAGLRFKVELGGRDTEAENILSEGQLGEVSLAAMLAANSAFPWSRWRALLLDDPTQHNDLIHATSLFDVLRNLVRSAGYQVFISTHDREQAGFLKRKLESVSIAWVDCRYVAHDPDGIVVETIRSV